MIKTKTKITRVRADTFGYLQRSFPGVYSERDAQEARTSGAKAVVEAVKGKHASGSIAIRRAKGKGYKISYERVPLRKVSRETRHVPASYINKAGNDVTKAFINYVTPIVGPLPKIGRFKGVAVKKKG